jgi:hypothetical protein
MADTAHLRQQQQVAALQLNKDIQRGNSSIITAATTSMPPLLKYVNMHGEDWTHNTS